MTFATFTTRLLALYAPPLRAPATLRKMGQVLAVLSQCPGLDRPRKLDAAAVAWFVARRSGEVCVNTVVGELGYLRAACAFAADSGWLKASPFAANKRLRVRPEPPAAKPWHGVGDVAKVLAHLAAHAADSWEAHRLYALACTAACTGLRRDESLRMRVEDVDLSQGLLAVVARRRSRLKTLAAAAPVPVPAALGLVLERWIPAAGSAWLFPTRSRRSPWTGGSPGNKPLDRLKAAGLAAGVEGFTFQSLRHSWATAAEGPWGLTEPQIQRVLRHTRPLTQRAYRHADAEALRAIAARVSFPAPAA